MYVIIGIIVFLFTVKVKPEECVTPNKEKAECISLYSCSVLIHALATDQESAIEFVRQSNCGGTAINPMVCCGSSGNFTVKNENTLPNITEKLNLLPTRRYCGFQHSDDYISTKTDSLPTITEFPWLAAIVYKDDDNRLEILCSGSLISRRYVITAVHCIIPAPVAVYLGEYHVNNKTDCVREPPFEEECSTPVEVFGIEKAIPHREYRLPIKNHDIALLRLNRTVTYSGDVLISCGWGHTHSSGHNAEIKKKIFNILIANEQCAQLYPIYRRRSSITENLIYTLPNVNKSGVECQGDGGGPLLFSHRHQWHQEGVISFSTSCGTNEPRVYTRVVKYIDWILENIET